MSNYFNKPGTPNYSQFIHLSRYSRWIEEKGRRETWEETTKRYVTFFAEKFPNLKNEILSLQEYILNFEVMPSMRALMSSGKALTKDEIAGYNCSAISIDNQRAFDEIFYVLMCGSGVGFSVERQFVNKLPEVAESFYRSDTIIVVPDSKIGWATSFRELISLLYSGKIPKWDLSRIRPSGARLKTFGGRASGPQPLDNLFRFAINLFQKAAGRKLNSLECHDLVCKIADVVVVGGVRRCLPEWALVHTKNGLKKIKDIKTGDWVQTNIDSYKKVLAKECVGKRNVITIRTEMGDFVCTPEHRMGVSSDLNSNVSWINAYDLEPNKHSLMFCEKDAESLKLTNINSIIDENKSFVCYDIQVDEDECFIAEGFLTHNSACISLSNVSDDRMRMAKSGQWWIENKQRRLSNNSACYTEKPELEVFMREWLALYESKSGERGIFNRVAAKKKVAENGRRVLGYEWLCNPCCVVGDTIIMTEKGPRFIKDLKGKPFKAIVNGKSYPANKGSWIAGIGDVYKLTTDGGYEVTLTKEHKVLTLDKENNEIWVMAKDLIKGQRIKLHNHGKIVWPGDGSFTEGFLLGNLIGYNNFTKKNVNLIKENVNPTKENVNLIKENVNFTFTEKPNNQLLGINKFNIDANECDITNKIQKTSHEFQMGFLCGFMNYDCFIKNSEEGCSVNLESLNLSVLKKIQIMFSHFGVNSVIKPFSDFFRLTTPCNKKTPIRKNEIHIKNKSDDFEFFTEFKSLEYVGKKEVWDAEVSEVHAFDANGLYVHNSEVILRNCGLCNLSEIVARQNDTLSELKEKARIATIFGTLQSTLTSFRYLRKIWSNNTEEERLLGVSITGAMDHEVLSDPDNPITKAWLTELKEVCINTNKEWANKLGINESSAITCVKPSGTVSQLCNTASGIHARYSDYYIRRVRIDKKDPLCVFMRYKGFPCELDIMNDENYVFHFPIKSPDNSVKVKDLSALKQLKIWKIYQDYWCEHKPSCTVYYKEDEFLAVGAWVWENFDDISGISFLPYSDHIYDQAPYEKISEKKYEELLEEMPKDIDWNELKNFEKEDNTVGMQTYACSGDSCEIVDLVSEK